MPRSRLLGWTPDDAARHVASMSESPEKVLARMTRMRSITDGQSQAAQFVLARLHDAVAYVCGQEQMVADVREALRARGMPDGNIFQNV